MCKERKELGRGVFLVVCVSRALCRPQSARALRGVPSGARTPALHLLGLCGTTWHRWPPGTTARREAHRAPPGGRLAACPLTADSRLGPLHRPLPTPPCSLRSPPWMHPRTEGTRLCRLLRRFRGLPRPFTSRTWTLLRVRALPLSSRAWRPQPSPTRDRHHLCLPSLRSVTVTTGAANAPAKVSPPSLDSCGTSRTSTQVLPWTSLLAPCSLRLSGSRARPACGGLRRLGARVCNRCGQASQARPPQVGDTIMGPLGAPASAEDTIMVDADAAVTPSLNVDLPLVDLPSDFTQRIRALPSNTVLHVPASCRLRMISVVAQCWNGMAQGRDDYAQLEEGRSKLLLSSVPMGLSAATEILKRLTLWEERRFEALLQRAEEQLLLKRKTGKRHKNGGPSDPTARGDRARRTATVGAYRKATTGLVSSMLSFDEQEDTRWAQELLPTSDLGAPAHSDPNLAPPPAPPVSTWDRPFSGLHYAALTAPGPTGTRPEHITDLLNVPRRVHANKIHAALSALFCRISAGSLPPAARWLTRTRLCWQRKKNGKPRPIKMGEF